MRHRSVQTELQTGPVWTVAQLCFAIKSALRSAFPLPVRVAGEVSQCMVSRQANVFFDLKDAGGVIGCICYRETAERVDAPFPIADGTAVEVVGRVTIYEKRSVYQLVVDDVVPVGRGALYRQFELLKEKLGREGLFDEARKRPIPAFVRAVAIVTSRDGAALRDFVTAIRRRGAYLSVALVDAPVQGAAAAVALAAAIRRAGTLPVDAVVVARGGGSIEDLWAFNTEEVARAIAACRRPVISAVGHETDVTIADFVADMRAATPTAAAILVAHDQIALVQRLDKAESALSRALKRCLAEVARRLASCVRALLRAPEALVALRSQHLDHVTIGLERASPRRRLAELLQRERLARLRLAAATGRMFAERGSAMNVAAARLHALGPPRTLERGYAIVFDARSRIVTDSGQTAVGEAIDVVLKRGGLRAAVTEKRDKSLVEDIEGL